MKIQVRKTATLTGHRDCIYTVAAADTPDACFSAGGDGFVVRWDLRAPDQGALVARVPNSVYAMHYLPEVDLLLVGQNYAGVHAIRVADKQEVKSSQITDQAIFDLCPWGEVAFAATARGYLLRLDLRTLTVQHRLQLSTESCRTIALHPHRPEMALGFSDHRIRVLELPTLRVRHTIAAHDNSVFALQYSPDGRHLLSGSRDAHLKMWETERYTLAESVVAHMFAINDVVYDPTGQYFATGSMDKAVKVWDAARFKLLKVIDKSRHAGHGTSVNKLLWPRPDCLLSASDDRTLSVWELTFPTVKTEEI